MAETEVKINEGSGEGSFVPTEALGDLPKILNSVSPNVRETILREVRVVISRSFSGPYPPPWMLDDYERHHPGFLSGLVAQAQEAQRHEQDMDRLRIEGPLKNAQRGQWLGFASLVIGFAVVVFGMWMHEPFAAATIGALIAVVGLFTRNPLTGPFQKGQERSPPEKGAPRVPAAPKKTAPRRKN